MCPLKKVLASALLLLLLLVGCSAKKPPLPEPDVTLSSAQLRYGEETVTVTDEALLEQLQADVAALSFQQSDANILEPGAVSLEITLVTSQGTKISLTLPLCQSGGQTWDAGSDSVARFAPYFED